MLPLTPIDPRSAVRVNCRAVTVPVTVSGLSVRDLISIESVNPPLANFEYRDEKSLFKLPASRMKDPPVPTELSPVLVPAVPFRVPCRLNRARGCINGNEARINPEVVRVGGLVILHSRDIDDRAGCDIHRAAFRIQIDTSARSAHIGIVPIDR